MKSKKSNIGAELRHKTQRKSNTPILDKLTQKLKRRTKKIGSVLTRKSSADDFLENISIGLSDKLGFGKYKSKTIKKIIEDDPMYLQWLLDNNETIRFNKAVMKSLEMFSSTTGDTDRYDPMTFDWSVGLTDAE